MKISAVVAIKNEEETWKESLKSIQDFVDEIVVADIGMNVDLREKVASMKKVKVISFKQNVPYIELIRQELIDRAVNEWILLLDPDEVFPPALLEYVKEHMDRSDYFIIPRKNIIMGKWMRHSRWWPDPQVRLFRKKAAKWSTIIHSKPELNGNAHEVHAEEDLAIEHYNYLRYDEYLEKSKRYAKAEASEKVSRNETFTLLDGLKLGLSEFISRYFAGDGYKDGMHGFIMSFSQFLYYFQVYVYFWEARSYDDGGEEVRKVPQVFFNQGLQETVYWVRKKKIGGNSSRLQSWLLKKWS